MTTPEGPKTSPVPRLGPPSSDQWTPTRSAADHRSLAEQYLDEAWSPYNSRETAKASALLQFAQVHATLALVLQGEESVVPEPDDAAIRAQDEQIAETWAAHRRGELTMQEAATRVFEIGGHPQPDVDVDVTWRATAQAAMRAAQAAERGAR